MRTRNRVPELVVIGGSLGGWDAAKAVLATLPASFPAAIALVLHRDPLDDVALEELTQPHCDLPVVAITDKQVIIPGRVYVAPPAYHALVEDHHFALSADPPIRFARPSIDWLFESAAVAFGDRLVGVILSGANSDGARGLTKIQQCGGLVVVQDPREAEAAAMPKAAIKATGAARIMRVNGIGPFLVEMTSRAARG